MKKFKISFTVTETYSMVIEAETLNDAEREADILMDETQDPMLYYLDYRDENPDWLGGSTEFSETEVVELPEEE